MRRLRLPAATIAHVVTLAATAVLLLWLDRGQWFAGDEWAPIADRWNLADPATLLAPHNEHWSTLPILVYRALYETVGLRTYLPYMAITVLLHVATASALWRIALRGGADRWIATVLAAVFLLSSAGAENLTWAFQMGFIGSIWLGLEQVLLLDTADRRPWRDATAIVAGIAALLCSGIGIVMAAVGGLVALARRGPARALLVVAPQAAVFGAWYAVYGRHAATPGPHGAPPAEVAVYVARALAATVGRAVTVPVLGGELLALLGIAVLIGLLRDGSRWIPATALAGGAGIFFTLTGLARISTFGVGTGATTSRYLYVGVALLVPAAALALSPLARLPGGAVALALLTIVPVWRGVEGIAAQARAEEGREQALRRIVVAVAALAGDSPPVGEAMVTPNLDVSELIRLRDDGVLPEVAIGDADRRAAAALLRVTLTEQPQRPVAAAFPPDLAGAHEAVVTTTGPGCVDVDATHPDAWVELRFPRAASLRIGAVPGGDLASALVRPDGLVPRFVPLHLDADQPRYLNVGFDNARIRLGGMTGMRTTLCGLGP